MLNKIYIPRPGYIRTSGRWTADGLRHHYLGGNMPDQIDKSKAIVGQLIFRDTGATRRGCRLMMVVGLITMPDELQVKDDHQYVVGNLQPLMFYPSDRHLRLDLMLDLETDVSEEGRGRLIGDLLTQPIWRV